MRFYFSIVCVLPLLICCSEDVPSQHCKLAGKLMTQFISDVEKQHGFFCYGSGGGFLDRVNEIHLSFATLGPKSLEELRTMMVSLVEDFLKRINSDEDIRKYLVHYPFQPGDLEFRISLMGLDGRGICNRGKARELLRSISLLEGKLFYRIENDEKACLQNVHREPYEEALAIVRKEHPELLFAFQE